jgi:predicted TIM-barrel fold metal-dependent hydrolase
MTNSTERHIVISTDGHCGADLWDYKPYLEKRFHADFDAWANAYHDPWGVIEQDSDAENRHGFASYEAPLNWESERRAKETEAQGIAAEVLFPNTAPPFIPSGSLSAPGPRTAEEYEYRWVGLQAHNRWLADFCADLPGRRAGLAQVLLDNIDDAVAEARWAKDAGLMGILLPGDHVQKLTNLYYPAYEPLWQVCADLDIPVHRHAIVAVESAEEAGPGAPIIGSTEIAFYGMRGVWHMMASGVFERHPTLKLVTTELGTGSEIPAYLARLDMMVDLWNTYPQHYTLNAEGLAALHRKPSEYFETNCYVGGPLDLLASVANGTPNMMFGADVPHAEGTAPYTTKALRLAFSSMSEAQRRTVLSLRAAEVYGFDLDLLQQVADLHGPTDAELSHALPDEERPVFPDETRCRIFAFK